MKTDNKTQTKRSARMIPLAILAFVVSMPLFQACNDDDPEPENEEELITTLTMTFTNDADAGDVVVATFRDLDGDGGNPPTISNPTLSAGATYSAAIVLLNETETPPEDITEEVEEEGEEHQFFFSGTASLGYVYTDMDASGNPIGITSRWDTESTPTDGTLTVILRHEPDKNAAGVSDGDITNAGGETDIEVTFDVSFN